MFTGWVLRTVTVLKPASGRGVERWGRVRHAFPALPLDKTGAGYTLGANTGMPSMGWYYGSGMAVADIYC